LKVLEAPKENKTKEEKNKERNKRKKGIRIKEREEGQDETPSSLPDLSPYFFMHSLCKLSNLFWPRRG
jgi:hypothetical protein